ncbi:MAG: hypothetical protein EA356_12455 [Geminicoccaceae bacterium]|nr:MAG: hypothetical protein EA356_12455 [Geminicoccaceae bacterium]
MSTFEHRVGGLQVAEAGVATEDETASLVSQIGTDVAAKRMQEFNHIVAASLVALCDASPYMASILLKISEEDARRLGELTPMQVYELAKSSSFLVIASPVLPQLVDQLLDPTVNSGPALFAYAMQRGHADAGR